MKKIILMLIILFGINTFGAADLISHAPNDYTQTALSFQLNEQQKISNAIVFFKREATKIITYTEREKNYINVYFVFLKDRRTSAIIKVSYPAGSKQISNQDAKILLKMSFNNVTKNYVDQEAKTMLLILIANSDEDIDIEDMP